MPEKDRELKLSKEDDYDERHFLEPVGDDSNGVVIVVNNHEVVIRVNAHIETDEPVGPRVRDRRGHLWALNDQGDNQYELDLHGMTPRQRMEEK
jgi:hypothetical protein